MFILNKKKLFLITVGLLAIILTLAIILYLILKPFDNNVIAKVGSEVITKQQVNNNLSAQEIIYKKQIENIEKNSAITSKDKENLLFEIQKNKPTEERTRERLIRIKLIEKDAKRLNIHVTEEEARQELMKTLDLMNQLLDSEDKMERINAEQSIEMRRNEIKRSGLDEKTYIEEYELPNQITVMIMNKHYHYYCENIYSDIKDNISPEESYNQYLKELEKEFDVKR